MRRNRKHNPMLTPWARALRKNMTKQERHMWYDFLRNYPVRILRQKVIGRFIADFYCAQARLVIEIDGGQHFTEDGLAYDQEREREMQRFGLETIRFTNYDVDKNFEAVCSSIDEHIKNRMR